MKKIRLDQAKPYEVAKHFNMVAFGLHDKEETGSQRFRVALSHFLPGGGAEYEEAPTEKVYFILEGEITVKTRNEELILGHWDSVYIAPNEGRELLNKTNKPVSMLVVVGY